MTRTTRTRRTARSVLALVATAAVAAGVVAPPSGSAVEAQATDRWTAERRILNMAHGGGLHEVPQGTVYAYATAAARGANTLEMDLHITLDGHVVAIHDSTVDRTTDGMGCVVAKTLAELKALDAAHTFVPGEGPRDGRPAEQYTMRGIATGEVAPPPGFEAKDFTIATLEEIFQAVPDALMLMELKPTEVYQGHDCPGFVDSLPSDQRPDLAAEVARLIHEYDMGDKVMVASFIDELMLRFQSFAPDVDTSFPLGDAVQVYLAYLAGTPPPNPHGHEALQVPRSFEGIAIDRPVVEYARSHGIAVHFWTINDPVEMAELLDWGADGLITDRPQVLAALLEERGDVQPSVGSETVLVPAVDSPSAPGEPVGLTATVTSRWPHPTATGAIELRSGDEVLATAPLTDGSAGFVVDHLPVGASELVAAYTGSDRVLSSTSAPVPHLVQAPATTTTTTISTTSTTSTTVAGAAGVDPTPPGGGPDAVPGPPGAGPAGGSASPRTSNGTLPVTGSGISLVALACALLAGGAAAAVAGRSRRRLH